MKIDDLITESEVQQLDELKAGKYAQVASLLGALAAQHGGKAADAATVGWKQQAPHALATLATYADPKKLGALPATMSADELNRGEDEWKRQRDKIKIGRLIPSLKEGDSPFRWDGRFIHAGPWRLDPAGDAIAAIPPTGTKDAVNIYDQSKRRHYGRSDEIYLHQMDQHNIPKGLQPYIAAYLQGKITPEQIANHLTSQLSSMKKESTMKMNDLEEGNKENKEKKNKVVKREKDKMSDFDPRRDLKKKIAETDNRPSTNFTIDDIKKLERISDINKMKLFAKQLISTPSQKPMRPEKVAWLTKTIDSKKTPIQVIKLMYDLLLGGEGSSVIGSRHSTDPNSYRRAFGEEDKRMSRAGKGVMKYGKDGMKALAKAGRDGASEEKLDKLRDKYDKYEESLEEKWSQKYKDSINCSNPKGFSQKAHCDGKKKNEVTEPDHEASMAKGQLYNACKNAMALMKMIEDGENLEGWVAAKITKAADYLDMVHDYMAYEEVSEEKQRLDPKCWKGYRKQGTKMKGGVRVNNCVKVKKD